MSSEGGRWPKKLYIFLDFVKNDPDDGDRAVVVGEGGDSGDGTGTGTPRPDMTLTVEARFVCLLVGLVAVRRSPLDRLPKLGRGVVAR